MIATRELRSARAFGDYATVLFATTFLQSFFDLTVEEAIVKYGFHYLAQERWGRLRRLFLEALVVKTAGAVIGAGALVLLAIVGPHRLEAAFLLAAAIPIGQSLDGLAGAPLYLHGRYDLRSVSLAWGSVLRVAGVAVGAQHGVPGAIAGILAAQVVSTLSVGGAGIVAFRRFPASTNEPLGEDRREIVKFIAQSSAATGVLSLRVGLAPLLLGLVTNTTQVGLFKVAQTPQVAFQALSAPVRMVLLTDQTRDWERGKRPTVFHRIERYSAVALALSALLVPALYWLMPSLVARVYGSHYDAATPAARIFLIVAALQLIYSWTESFPVTIGRPALRIYTHGIESVTVLPLIIVLGTVWHAAGAAAAVLAGTCAFCVAWTIILMRIRPSRSDRGLVDTAPAD